MSTHGLCEKAELQELLLKHGKPSTFSKADVWTSVGFAEASLKAKAATVVEARTKAAAELLAWRAAVRACCPFRTTQRPWVSLLKALCLLV